MGFSTTMRKISSRKPLLMRFLPKAVWWRVIQFQYRGIRRDAVYPVWEVTIAQSLLPSWPQVLAATQKQSISGSALIIRQLRQALLLHFLPQAKRPHVRPDLFDV